MALPPEVIERVRAYIQHQGTKSPEAIAELVAAGHEKFLAVVAGVDDAQAAKKPAADEWSLRELALHTITAENGVCTAVVALSNGAHRPEGQPSSSADRLIGMTRDDDGSAFAHLIAELREVHAKTLDAIRAIPADPDLSRKPPHPFFGPLHVREWAAFQRVHDEDHAQHAQKILDATA